MTADWLVQPVDFLSDRIVSATIGGQWWLTQNRLVQPVAQTYITNSRQVDWLGGWIGGYMLCGWCSLSSNCTHGGWLVQPVAMLFRFVHFVAVCNVTAESAGKSLLLAARQLW